MLTDRDIVKLKTVFATKDDLKKMKEIFVTKNGFNKSIHELVELMTEGFNRIEARIDKTMDKVEGHEFRLNRLEHKVFA